MVEIKTLTELAPDSLTRLVTGYVSNAKYAVSKTELDNRAVIGLELVGLESPYVKRFPPPDEEAMQRYTDALRYGLSLGAYEGDQLVGVVVAELQRWNGSLWVMEFHVAETHRRQGIGRQMMEELVERGRASGLRIVVCETQNTHVPAIHFYRRVGFNIEGIDLSYYSNDDWPEGEVAVFMKRRLALPKVPS